MAELQGGSSRILVVNDGSSDATVQMAAKYADVASHPRNMGLGKARNTAVENTHTKYIAFLDADVVPERAWLVRMMRTFAEKQDTTGVEGRLVEESRTSADQWRARHMEQTWGLESRRVQYLHGNNCIYVRDAIVQAGMFDVSCLTNGEDANLGRRITEKGDVLWYDPRPVCHHLRTDNIRSVLETHWRWYFSFPMHNVGWFGLRRRLTIYAVYALRYLKEDLGSKNAQIILIDLLLVPYYLHLELRLWPRKWRLRSERAARTVSA